MFIVQICSWVFSDFSTLLPLSLSQNEENLPYFLLLNQHLLALVSSYLTFMTSSKELTLQVFKVTKIF